MMMIRFNKITADVYGFILDATAGLLTDQEIADDTDSEIIGSDIEDFLR